MSRQPHSRHAVVHRTREEVLSDVRPVTNVNQTHSERLSRLEVFALKVTNHIGSPQFFLIILGWTILWTGYNILATMVPAFVAYLLISNVIQILLMPLIMVGQNLQSRHAELRAENDFEINVKAETEIKEILLRLERHQALMEDILSKIDPANKSLPQDTHS
jgi:uncharacterized membrane protein